ncbi:hypothetical protein IMZ48_00720 [Candidatus Bathyarchaeota archaeon]|nr:hypothetical protein [Candidatus Bathyarchaeota archaeon]
MSRTIRSPSSPRYTRAVASLDPRRADPSSAMADMQGRKVFKVFNQDFAVDDRYTVTKELGQGAYGIVW